jgi:alkylhydroperoxidase family enzyme
MAWIKTVGFRDPELTPELARVYQQVNPLMPAEYAMNGTDDAPGIIKAHSLDPAGLEKIFRAGLHLVNGPSPLSRREREMINTVVSAANRCFY